MCRCVFILGLMRTLENARLPCQSPISFGNGTHVGMYAYMGLSCCWMRTPNHTLLAVWISFVVCKLYTRGHVRTCSGVSMYRGFDSPRLKNTRFFFFLSCLFSVSFGRHNRDMDRKLNLNSSASGGNTGYLEELARQPTVRCWGYGSG